MLRTPVVLVFCVLANQAWADVRRAPKLRIPPEARRAAVSGQEYEGVLEFTAGNDATLNQIQLTGDGWQVLSINPSTDIEMIRGEIVLVTFRAIPTNADNDLRLTYVYEGRSKVKNFNVGPIHMAKREKASTLKRADGLPMLRPNAVDPNPPEGGNPATGQFLHITGRFVYVRPGDPPGMVVGADTMYFQIMDDDSPSFDEEIYEGHTDIHGNFDVAILWDDCDITGCDDPDIYLYIEADNSIVTVQADSILEENYSWSTEDDRWDDFTGSFIDFGTFMPTNADQYPALHIHNSIVRAHRFIYENDGTAVEQIDVQWPEDGDGAFYNPDFEEIHIAADEQWTEGTHTHEYGHHYMENYSVNSEPDYCNGFCDVFIPPVTIDCSHCLFCPETDHDAWNEGWPNWLGHVVNQVYLPRYGITPLSIADFRYAIETTANCQVDSQPYDALITEGFAAALLTDMTDTAQDDQDGGTFDCDIDSMSIEPADIFQIVREDQPVTPLQFITTFRSRHPEHDQDFWSTTRNVSLTYGFPTPVPSITSPPQSCKSAREGELLTISVSGNGSRLIYQWRRDGVNMIDNGRITGTKTPNLQFNPLDTIDAGYYSVKVSTCDNTLSVISPEIRVHVFPQLGGGQAGLSWGRNTFGATGQGAFLPDTTLPNPIVDVNQFTAISPGTWHTIALKSDGTVWAWGDNTYGELGNNSNIASPEPVMVQGLTDIVRVSAGGCSNMAVKADGKVYAWGSDFYGQLSLPTEAAQAVPVQIPGLECVTSVSIGGYHSMVIKSDGTVWTCGNNTEGQLGLGNFGGWVQTLQQVPGINDAVDGLASNLHSVVLRSNGTLLAWGRNNSGELGDGTMVYRASPVPVIGIENVRSIHGKGYHTLAVRLDGTVWGWGAGGFTTIFNTLVPTQIPGLTNIVEAAGSWSCSAYLRSDGTVWVSGGNYHGGLGISTGVGSNFFIGTPFRVAHIAGATKIAAGAQHFSAIVPSAPPTVIQPPPNQTRIPGQSLAMTVGVVGTPQFQYQWLYNGSPMIDGGTVTGATEAVLSINPVAPGNAGNYSVHVTNAYGNTTSSAGVLTISNMSGDVNGDGTVNGFDYSAFVACYGAPGVPPNPMALGLTPQTCTAIFDIGNDGDVDIRNFADFQNAFGG